MANNEPKFEDTIAFEDTQPVEEVPSFEDTVSQEEIQPEAPKMNQAQAAIEGLTQGATFGLSDELAGIFEAAGRAGGLKGLGGPMRDIEAAAKGPTLEYQKLLEAYRAGRGASRGQLQAAEEQFPATTMAADIAGGFAIPGGVVAKGTRGIAKTVGRAATEGALESAGRTEEDLLSQEGIRDVALGAGTAGAAGGILGRLAKKAEPQELLKKSKELKKEADEIALRSMGISPKNMEKHLESTIKRGKMKGSGIYAIEKEIIDPLTTPKKAYEKVIKKIKETGNEYDDAINVFKDNFQVPETETAGVFSNRMSQLKTDIMDELDANDMITPDMMKKVNRSTEAMVRDVQGALTSENPIKALQDVYVTKYNDQYFKNLSNPTANIRRMLRDQVKGFQRDLVRMQDPKLADDLSQLDLDYTKLLELEGLSRAQAAKDPKLGIGDFIKGGIAKMSGVPGAGELVTGASVLSKKTLGKDISDVVEGVSSINKLKRSKKLMEKAKKLKEGTPSFMEDVAKEVRETGIRTGAAIIDDTNVTPEEQKEVETYRQPETQKSANLVDRFSDEELLSFSQELINSEDNNEKKLGNILQNMTKNERSKTIGKYRIMQNPAYRNILENNYDLGDTNEQRQPSR